MATHLVRYLFPTLLETIHSHAVRKNGLNANTRSFVRLAIEVASEAQNRALGKLQTPLCTGYFVSFAVLSLISYVSSLFQPLNRKIQPYGTIEGFSFSCPVSVHHPPSVYGSTCLCLGKSVYEWKLLLVID